MSTPHTIWSDIHIRGPEAVWVFTAHVYALFVPLAIVVAVAMNFTYLTATTYNPFLFFVAACLMSAGGAFEAAQNTMDHWYLTEESASANGIGLADFMFYWLVTAGQAVSAVAIGGDKAWVVVVSVASVVALPAIYFRNGPYFAPMTVTGLLAIVLAYQAFGEPVVFLQLVIVAATIYFFQALLRTKAQMLHGFTTLAASSGAWFLIWAMINGAAGRSSSWLLLVLVAVLAVVAGVLLWPGLNRLPETRRVTTTGA